jgi:DNA-binding winged helix-turn-helix (wHTH) protein
MTLYRLTGPYEFDPATGEVHREGFVIKLEPQPSALLALLADRAGEVVTHDEIRRAIWGDATSVTSREDVHYCVRQIRTALCDSAEAARFIETIPRRGYRFRREALVSSDADAPAGASAEGNLRSRAPKWLAVACLGCSLL